jgi:hypoxanthine phosphoribosyltransferase
MPTKYRKGSPTVHPDLESVMYTEAQIKKRVREPRASEVRKAAYGDGEFTIVSIINGAVMFTADLMREIDNPGAPGLHPDLELRPTGRSRSAPRRVVHSLTLDIAKRHVLLIDDILDTGKTIALVAGHDRESSGRPACATCVLLDKQGRREVPYEADFVGFKIPDRFVVGYGLDFAERYRNLPCIGVLNPQLQNPPEWA